MVNPTLWSTWVHVIHDSVSGHEQHVLAKVLAPNFVGWSLSRYEKNFNLLKYLYKLLDRPTDRPWAVADVRAHFTGILSARHSKAL